MKVVIKNCTYIPFPYGGRACSQHSGNPHSVVSVQLSGYPSRNQQPPEQPRVAGASPQPRQRRTAWAARG